MRSTRITIADGADAVEVVGPGILDVGVALRDQAAAAGRPASASSTAAIERSRATKSGSTMYGKTTISRSGRTGSSSGIATPAARASMHDVSTPREGAT